jgi:hypothetical protein
MAGLILDAISENEGFTATPQTDSHVVGSGSNRILIAGIRVDPDPSSVITSVTYSGIPMSLVGNISYGSPAKVVYLYQLKNPPSGTANIVANFSGGGSPYVNIAAVSYTNAVQDATQGTIKITNTGSGVASLSTTLTSLLNNSIQICMVGTQSVGCSAGTNTSSISSNNAGLYGSSNPISPAGSNTITINSNSTDNMGMISAIFSPINTPPFESFLLG